MGTHADEAVALIARVEHLAEACCGECVARALAATRAIAVRDHEAELVVGGRSEPGVRDEDGAASGLAQAARVADVDADAAVLRAAGIVEEVRAARCGAHP